MGEKFEFPKKLTPEQAEDLKKKSAEAIRGGVSDSNVVNIPYKNIQLSPDDAPIDVEMKEQRVLAEEHAWHIMNLTQGEDNARVQIERDRIRRELQPLDILENLLAVHGDETILGNPLYYRGLAAAFLYSDSDK